MVLGGRDVNVIKKLTITPWTNLSAIAPPDVDKNTFSMTLVTTSRVNGVVQNNQFVFKTKSRNVGYIF